MISGFHFFRIFDKSMIISGMAIIIVIFSGCGGVDEDTPKTTSEGPVYGAASENPWGDEEGTETHRAEDETAALESAVKAGDVEQCATLDNPIMKESCETNAIITKAKQTQDPTLCEAILDEDSKVYCLNSASQ
ncbi:MAG: hypothetical protein UT55_C0003G0003 [Candidatus Peregrinibacteria bacterium GW2011_GWE2_39_6]|nr:MAG: hypothetical protein UT36_C0005G0108 [Candidatus Peregrinibacteria bacterium GW2011_GWF2_39_17]KKR26692.1 MAG: hypothetical protein UT55_C0003G0003 [Candidatus Peregrinibacteria bacterium GW2011_GWE2_39_6]HCW32943.1 hypothetical protein [Candidatus Peregrinibacteria bacterium]